MTTLIELDSDNRASLRRLFDRYPCLHGSVAAVIEGGMGRVFADAQEEPCVALAVLDFHFLAGDTLHANALLLFKLLQPGDVVIAPTPGWQHLIAATYPSALAVYRREAFQAALSGCQWQALIAEKCGSGGTGPIPRQPNAKRHFYESGIHPESTRNRVSLMRTEISLFGRFNSLLARKNSLLTCVGNCLLST